MPIITRKRSIRSRVVEVLLAPILAPLAMIILNSPFFLIALPIVIFVIWMSGEPLSALWPTPHAWTIIGMSYAFIGLVAFLLSCRDVFTTGRFEQIWLADPNLIDATWRFAERLLSGDRDGAFALLTPEEQTPESWEALRVIEHSLRDGRDSMPAIDMVSDVVLPPSELDEHDEIRGVSRVRLVDAPADEDVRDAGRLIVWWTRREQEYRVCSFFLDSRPVSEEDEDSI